MWYIVRNSIKEIEKRTFIGVSMDRSTSNRRSPWSRTVFTSRLYLWHKPVTRYEPTVRSASPIYILLNYGKCISWQLRINVRQMYPKKYRTALDGQHWSRFRLSIYSASSPEKCTNSANRLQLSSNDCRRRIQLGENRHEQNYYKC